MGEVGQGYLSAKKKTGSARTSKKSKRRNAVRYIEWSEEQEPVNSSPTGVQQQALDIEVGDAASPELAGKAVILVVSAVPPGASPSLDHGMRDASPDYRATAPTRLSLPDDQDEDVPIQELHSGTISVHSEEIFAFQRAREEQKADDWSSENMRQNAQNLRYGGYPAQLAPQNRNTPLVTGRLQNTTKLGAVEILPFCVVQWSADASRARQAMARIGALEHLRMVHRDCPAYRQATQAWAPQVLRREWVVLNLRHL